MAYSTREIVNFSGGEASPGIKARVDVAQYYTLAETLENVICSHYGGAIRTPGTRYVKRARGKSKLIPFIFSEGDAYILEFSNQKMRVFQDNGSIVESHKLIDGITRADPAVVTTMSAHGYSTGDTIDIDTVVGMTELNRKRFKVTNLTSTTFSLQDEDGEDIDSTGYSAYTMNGRTLRVYEIATPYLEADLDELKYAQSGDILYIACKGYEQRELRRFSDISWTLSTPSYDTLSWPAFDDVNVTATTITPSATTGTGITLTASTSLFTADYVGSYIKMTHSSTTGYVKVTAYSSGTSVTADVIATLGGTGATDDWYNGMWSSLNGWPVDVTFYEQRLYYFRGLRINGSEQGVFDNFDNGTDSDPTEATDPVSYTIGANQVDSILWAYPTKVLNIGTAGGPFTASSGSSTEPITPTSISVLQQNEDGASSVSPVRIGPFLYYVEQSGNKIAQLSYNLEYDVYETENLTYLSDHILGDGVIDMALQKYPYSILWCVLSDGTVATCTRELKNNVRGWTRQIITDGEVESVAIIPNGAEDQVWISVKRTVGETEYRAIEYFETFDFGDKEDAFFIQSGLTYNGTATDTLSGLDHLEGQTVSVYADGAVHPDKTVSDGGITLDWEAEKIHVGLPYSSEIKTMDIEAGGSAGTAQAKVTFISQVDVRFLNSLGCQVGDGTTMDVIPFRVYGDNFDESPPLFTGDKNVNFPSKYTKNKYIVIRQTQPLPMHVLGLFPRLISHR